MKLNPRARALLTVTVARASLWLGGVALCLSAHTAAAQTRPPPYPLAEILRWARVDVSRVRVDDPDLIRGGSWPTAEAGIAVSARVLSAIEVDLDGDGVSERMMSVAPCEDPAPQNERPGIVVARRAERGWSLRVLLRPEPFSTNEYAWRVSRDRGRPRVVLFVHTSHLEERDIGGRENVDEDFLLRLTLAHGVPAVDALCTRTDRPSATHGWRALTPTCTGALDPEVNARCRRARAAPDNPAWFAEWHVELHEGAPHRWCRALSNLRPDDPLSTE